MRSLIVRWQHPPPDWYALNTDGAAKGSPGAAGGGAIIRNQTGTFVSALTGNFGYFSAFKAEIKALIRGLELTQNLEINRLQVQLDNLSCMQSLNSNEVSRGECTHLIEYCRSLIKNNRWEVEVMVYREGNRVADWLANQGDLHLSQLNVIENIPYELARILEEDNMGVALPRLIPP